MLNDVLLRLGETCLSGTVTILGVFLVLRVFKRMPGTVRCWIWWLVCLKLILGIAAAPILSLAVLPSKPVRQMTPEIIPLVAPGEDATATVSKEASAPAKSAPVAAESESVVHPMLSTTQLLIVLWVLGIGVGIGIQVMALIQLHRITIGATREDFSLLAEAARRAGLRHVPALWIAKTTVEPLTVGLLRPRILIGHADRTQLSESELLTILAHECTHIKRGDLVLSLAPWIAQTLFWFFPPVYLAVHEFELAREAACDQQTVAVLPLNSRTYGELLVKLSSSLSPVPVPSSAMALSAGFTTLKRRIEMLQVKPYRRSLIALTALLTTGLLIPWRLTAAPNVAKSAGAITLPNLNFASGLQGWHKKANGSDTNAHPFYEVGVDKTVVRAGKPSGFVRSRSDVDFTQDPDGDGGVLRYDVFDTEKYAGKRLRWSGYVKGKALSKRAFLFAGADSSDGGYTFSTSTKVQPGTGEWQKLDCVFDVPKEAAGLFLGLRQEGKGVTYGNDFSLAVVAKTVPLTEIKTIKAPKPEAPRNLNFTQGLYGWWNDNPTHDADTDYTMTLEEKGGRNGNPAVALKSAVAKPHSYGTVAQNAAPDEYLGKRIRISAYLKSDKAEAGDLWIVVHDKNPEKGGGANGQSTKKWIRGTQDWTKFEHIVDVPSSTEMLSFGISSEGPGSVWVDGFQIEVLGPAQEQTKISTEDSAPKNMDFANGLDGWWNDNPTHDADTNYAMTLEEKGGRNGKAAIRLENIVANPRSYGTVAQNAQLKAYKGKRLRISAYLKSENVKAGDLWIVVHDKDENKGGGANGESTGKWIRGTQDWTRFEHIVDVSETTQMLSFGISLKGEGKIWVDGFKLEQLGPPQKP